MADMLDIGESREHLPSLSTLWRSSVPQRSIADEHQLDSATLGAMTFAVREGALLGPADVACSVMEQRSQRPTAPAKPMFRHAESHR